MKVFAYIRVSTLDQDAENQRHELLEFARRNGFKIDEWIAETESGGKDYRKRQLNPLLKALQRGDRLICSELSRLGRELMMIMEILRFCLDKGVEVWTEDFWNTGAADRAYTCRCRSTRQHSWPQSRTRKNRWTS